jgi:hypothetical protein
MLLRSDGAWQEAGALLQQAPRLATGCHNVTMSVSLCHISPLLIVLLYYH